MKSSDLKRKLAIVYVLGAVSVLVLVVVGLIIVNGTQEDESSASAKAGQGSGSPPPLRTVAVERDEGGRATVAAASPSIDEPEQVWLRVSAAPKQEVSGSWKVSCGSGNVADGSFAVTPPHLMQLEVPDDHESCTVVATARLEETGRLKLTILRDR